MCGIKKELIISMIRKKSSGPEWVGDEMKVDDDLCSYTWYSRRRGTPTGPSR